jgi:hypothetical protein
LSDWSTGKGYQLSAIGSWLSGLDAALAELISEEGEEVEEHQRGSRGEWNGRLLAVSRKPITGDVEETPA